MFRSLLSIFLLTLSCCVCYESEYCSSEEPEVQAEVIDSYRVQQSDGSYKFGFSDTSGQFRVEERDEEGRVLGGYGYVDSEGKQVRVYYEAGVQGFRILSRELYQRLRHRMKSHAHPSTSLPATSNEEEEPRLRYPPIYYWHPPPTTLRWTLPVQQRYPPPPLILTI